jgi:hypothetical protein
MNQIINMFLKLIMRKVMSKGIDAGIKGATGMARKRKRAPVGEIDDYGNPTGQQDTSERDRIRAERRAKRAARNQD